jgi:Vam6/Vps39-like protein vacuolar protein sorting-associated protein 39
LRKEASPELSMDYLRWLINIRKDTNSEFHNELINHYFSIIREAKKQLPLDSPIHKQRAGTEPGVLGQTRKLLIDFLQKSKYYSAEKLLPVFVNTDLYEERAIMYSRTGHHEEALSTYVYNLNSTALAEGYCEQHYDENDSPDVYLYLLRVYLSPTSGGKQTKYLEPALRLLNNHYKKINAAKVCSFHSVTKNPSQDCFLF